MSSLSGYQMKSLKLKMTRKINMMLLHNQRKEERLNELRRQLQTQKDIHEKHQSDLQSMKHPNIVRIRNEGVLSPERVY